MRESHLLRLQGHPGFEERSVSTPGGGEELRLSQRATTLVALQVNDVAHRKGSTDGNETE